MHNFKNLKILKEGMELVSESYQLTRTFPEHEKFSLAIQMNRSAISIPSNIAEGSSKNSDKHFVSFLEHSLGSAFEWVTQLIIAFKEGYLNEERYKKLIVKIEQLQKMISRFQTRLH